MEIEGINSLAFNTADGTKTSSLILAEGTGNEHASLMKLIRKHKEYLEEFGRVGFEIEPFETAGGKQKREIALLNEQQATLLMTYMRNSKVVCEFKKNLVKAFYELVNGSANSLSHYNHKMDVARAQKLEVESRLIISARNIVSKSFPKSQRVQDQAFSTLCKKVVGYCPFEFIGISMDHNSDEPNTKIVQQFLEDCCVIKEDAQTDKRELFEVFESYQKMHCKANELFHYNYFCRLMLQYSFRDGRTGKGPRFWKGISLKKLLPDLKISQSIGLRR